MRILAFLVLLLFLSACGESLIVEKVDQSQAHEIVSVLNQRGISSQITKDTNSRSDNYYNIAVAERDRLIAISVISDLQLLKADDSEFAELTKNRSFMPNTQEVENLRIDRALAVEFERLLLTQTKVKSAKVIVRQNTRANQPGTSAVSVNLVCSDCDASETRDQIVGLAANSFPDARAENIVVNVLDAAEVKPQLAETTVGLINRGSKVEAVALVPFLIWQVPAGTDLDLSIIFLLVVTFAILFGGLIALVLLKRKNLNTKLLSFGTGGKDSQTKLLSDPPRNSADNNE